MTNTSRSIRFSRPLLSALLGLSVILLPGARRLLMQDAQQERDVTNFKANYEKHEYQVPMRDGVRLFTSVYAPRDSSRQYPILLRRTPYSVAPYGPDAYAPVRGLSDRFAAAGYIFVSQDVRGRYHSVCHFVPTTPEKDRHGSSYIDESTDTYDTIDWLLKNIPHNNGRVGLWGISYNGFFAVAGIIDAHPALKAASPQAPQADWFMGDDTHHNGAFFLTSTFNFMASCDRLGPGTAMSCGEPFHFDPPNGYQFFLKMGPLSNADSNYFHGQSPGWTEMMKHGTYDSFWRARNILPHLRNITPAVLSVGGWYDANNFYGALHVFETIGQQSPQTADFFVSGPWEHGQWAFGNGDSLGPLHFGSNTSKFFRDEIEFPFFEHYLRDGADPRLPKAYAFETGANRWRKFDTWPPNNMTKRSIYLGEGRTLSFHRPTNGSSNSFDEYVSDPANPVPFIPGPGTDMDPDYMAIDQRFAANRPDVLVYQSEALAEDLTAAGPIVATLFVSTSGTDSDWIIKLIDVHPSDGFQELVRGDVMRGKFRNSFEKPEPFTPGKVTKVVMTMPDVLHTFTKGHRMMLQIQSSWFPLVDPNPQRFEDIYRAVGSDFQKATERVYRSTTQSSELRLLVLPSAK